MYIRHLRLAGITCYPPEVGAGTTENSAGSVTEGQAAPTSTGNVTSGTASDAMIKAAMAASSAEGAPAPKAAVAGDTPVAGGPGKVVAKPEAIAQPKPDGQADTTVKDGAVPLPRHEAAVKNARDAGRAEVEKHYEGFKGLNVEDARVGSELLTEMRRDPEAFARQLLSEVEQSNGGKKTETVDLNEKFPPASLVSADGAKAYSDTDVQKILDIRDRQVEARVMARMKPAMDFYGTEKSEREKAQIRADVAETVTLAMTEARKLPQFKENEPLVEEKLAAMDPALKKRVGPIAAMHMAFQQVLAEKILPGYDTAAAERVRAENAKKAATSAGQVHPTEQGGEGKKPELKNQTDLARHMEKMAEAAAG